MKRIVLVVGVICWMCIGYAQKVKHPSLLYTPERISQVKQRMQHEPQLAAAWEDIKQTADKELKGKSLNKADYLSLAYLMTGDKRYSDKLKEILLDVIKSKTWGSSEMLARRPAWHADLGVAHKSYLSAIAYDAVYNDLSTTEKKKIAEGLYRLGVEPSLGDWLLEPTRIHSLNSMGHNWWTSCVCMGGILALSLQNELEDAKEGAQAVYDYLPEWFLFAGDVLQQKAKTFDEAGGMYESLNYANFGIQEALQFWVAWKNMHPSASLPDVPQLKDLSSFFAYVSYPRTGILYNINFGDSHKNVAAESSLMLLYALGIQDKNMLWYISQVESGQHRDGYFLNRPMGFLYTPSLKSAPEVPDLKQSQLFADFGWATMRNSWKKDATMLAVKSGHTWNHSHADANSFILFHKGVDIIKDAGNCWYPNPAYRNYFFQSQAHNVVLFNGQGQSREQQYHGSTLRGYLHHLLDGGNVKYVLANGTGPVSDHFSRNFRHFLWMDNVVYIIDDLKTHESGEFEWLWHPGGEWKKRGADVTITSGESSVVVRPLYPRLLALSDFVHDYPDDLYWEEITAPTEDLKATETYYSLHLPGKFNQIKGLTAVILKDSITQKDLPVMERREGKDWIGLRIVYKGKVTDLYINQLADGRLMHSNSWIEADGWTTDAYMFAVTYAEGTDPAETKDIFMAYGSALRRNDVSYFASMSKLFFIRKDTEKGLDLWINGQPFVNATFRVEKRPIHLSVNDKNMIVNYQKGNVKVKYTE
ncbi:heparinase II/III family protein [Phocaeicola coprocola]|uniref:heparinase II/III domain-containing protein n=1 Tax=Phocaeicola coprocola TaxID=310298 RepID=UPI00267083B4|nr:heparinase II/III family protein [Phocaeicola coprocola]